MIINKNNIYTYYKIILETRDRLEIIKYILKRIIGIRAKFDKDVILKQGDSFFNCGRIMENCTVACSQFEQEMASELKNLEEGTYIDVGAHIGKHTVEISKSLKGKGQVISVEADPSTAELLKKNIQMNNLKNVKIFNLVCVDKKGEVYFHKSDLHPATNSLDEIKNSHKLKLKSDTLDNLVGDKKDVKLIKIDVEGAEEKVLRGAIKILKNNLPKIIFEAWDNKNLLKVKSVLDPLGYKIRKIDEYNYLASKI
ncbi:hypothetical protein COU54_04485 [Candidatus Pacearchaeota archaeon CG10_big_fil_rev_8_21_14_0_10_31_24]|nr:MAG: hypothetical protein COU54_04485 [Candidatus Pacearchaeota archaeon CG10_big_fil_rev_8_21_14_0_10_31_24]